MISKDQKRLLALDGGGIMGLISLGILKKVESQLRDAFNDPDLRLRDFFDYVGGTSTGAIIAAGISIGMSIDEIEEIYTSLGEKMFDQASLFRRWRYSYDADNLREELKKRFGEGSILEMQQSGILRSDRHLLVVTRNINTDSAWPISTNPNALFNDTSLKNCNLHLPLWQLVRASTAAPTFFAPEELKLPNGESFLFEDGGVTAYNNPAFLLYRMATDPVYRCNWPSGKERMMLVSIGTGLSFRTLEAPNRRGESKLATAQTIPGELMRGIAIEQDLACRTIGHCSHGHDLDMEVGNMVPVEETNPAKAFTYARYDIDISQENLNELGLNAVKSTDLTMDNASKIDDLLEIGRIASKQVNLEEHFQAFLPRM